MSLIHRNVTNLNASPITIRIPGFNPRNPIVLQPSAATDLLTLVSEDELEALEVELNKLVANGVLQSNSTIDTANLHVADATEITNLKTVISNVTKFLVGTVTVGDVNAGSGALAVTGDITSASKVSGSSSSTITINYASVTNPVINFGIESLGNRDSDNDLEEPLLKNVTNTSCDIYLYEAGAVEQNLKLHITIIGS